MIVANIWLQESFNINASRSSVQNRRAALVPAGPGNNPNLPDARTSKTAKLDHIIF